MNEFISYWWAWFILGAVLLLYAFNNDLFPSWYKKKGSQNKHRDLRIAAANLGGTSVAFGIIFAFFYFFQRMLIPS